MQIPNTIPIDRDGQYCIACFSTHVEKVLKNNHLTYYHCSSCGKTEERSLVIDDKIVWWVDKENIYWHESVGVIVMVENKLLTLLRQVYPFAYSIPAGHLDKDELPEQAARREFQEETGITVSSLEILKTDFELPGDACRRGSDHHRWNLYRTRLNVFPKIQLCEEASKARWMTLQELRDEQHLAYPLRYFVDSIGARMFL